MRAQVCAFLALVVAISSNGASANPDGAPWGTARPDAPETCSSCHFDGAPGRQTGRATVLAEALESYKPGSRYNWIVTVRAPVGAKAGFLLEARSRDGGSGGFFTPFDEGLESKGSEIRSTAPRAAEEMGADMEQGAALWLVEWTAPTDAEAPVDIFLAANISNDDASPFGDQIEYLTITIPPD